MADYDDAERHALHEVEPEDNSTGCWRRGRRLAFFSWLPTQLAPRRVPQLRCDCVAGLRARSGTQPPWACLTRRRPAARRHGGVDDHLPRAVAQSAGASMAATLTR